MGLDLIFFSSSDCEGFVETSWIQRKNLPLAPDALRPHFTPCSGLGQWQYRFQPLLYQVVNATVSSPFLTSHSGQGGFSRELPFRQILKRAVSCMLKSIRSSPSYHYNLAFKKFFTFLRSPGVTNCGPEDVVVSGFLFKRLWTGLYDPLFVLVQSL